MKGRELLVIRSLMINSPAVILGHAALSCREIRDTTGYEETGGPFAYVECGTICCVKPLASNKTLQPQEFLVV
jgi:hypothetical protein